ncbi:MAG TPA: hypothetical protein VGI74_21785 [Streptosporangiaceae bacterium]
MTETRTGRMLTMTTDHRADFFFQVPAVRLHHSVLAALGLPDLTLVLLRRPSALGAALAWVTTGDDAQWDMCSTPWYRTVQLSAAAWRALVPDRPPHSGEEVQITFPDRRLAVRPARMEHLLAGDELGLHRADARTLGITNSAIVNYNGIPGIFRVVLSSEDRDRGFARLSYQSRMLLAVPQRQFELLPEILLAPLPQSRHRRPMLVTEPSWQSDRKWGSRAVRKLGSWFEWLTTALLGAPEVTFRTVDALPGEDHARTVRLAPELFPLLGTQPGRQVYVSYGPRNRIIATALIADDSTKGRSQWASTDRVGHYAAKARAVPPFARLRVGAEIRVGLGIPRTAVVTVHRRVTSLILAKLNELIIPATGLFIALSFDARLSIWVVVLAVLIILVLLLTPLRVRRNPQGRVP